MAKAKRRCKAGPYLGVDVGGTKILACVVGEAGTISARHRVTTPRGEASEPVIGAVIEAVDAVLKQAGLAAADVAAMGIGVPGVVDPKRGFVVVTPNMGLSGVTLGLILKDRFRIPVALGNDCNLGTLGECWLGAARSVKHAVGIFVGTGIGAGFVRKGKIWRGAREAACEIGHIVMEIGGPECGCGNRGCFEALAGRAAIERQLRAAIASGRPSVLPEILNGDLAQIRSKSLRKALQAGDELVAEVLHRAAEVIGHACLTVRHLLDPELIVLGGGVMEACGGFMMPVIQQIVASDRLAGARDGGHVVLSALGDDATVLGAVALARRRVGRNPFKRRYSPLPDYPVLSDASFGQVVVGGERYDCDVIIRADGKVLRRDKSLARDDLGSSHRIGAKELRKVCRGGPEVVFLAAGHSGQMELTDKGRQYLQQRLIDFKLLPTPEAVEAFNASQQRRAALIHVTC